MKRFMIVGASVLQLPAIVKAKEMGLYVAVADYNPAAIGIKFADEYFNASTMDEDAVLKAALVFNPDGIMTLATDMPMRGVAKVSEALNLHSIPYATSLRATDKLEMIQAFKRNNVPSPWFFAVKNKEELLQLEGRLAFPCVMKPTDNAGSHGVVLAKDFGELVDSFDYSNSYVRKGCVIIEEYLEGEEVSVEVMVRNGEPVVLQITDKLTTGAPHFVEMGHSQPTHHSPQTVTQIKEVASAACKAIGIDTGPAHVEMMITERGPVMIELGARLGGDNIATDLVPLSTGIDMVRETIRVAMGECPEITPSLDCGSAIRYIKAPLGTIRSIAGAEDAERVPGVRQVVFTKHPGEPSVDIRSSNDRIGYIIAQGANAEDAIHICETAMEKILITIE